MLCIAAGRVIVKKGSVMILEYDSYICKDDEGNVLLSVDRSDEALLSDNPLLTHCLAVVKIGDDHLLGWNRWRNRYEIFGGCIEKGETARDCIIRECSEELGLVSEQITFLGSMKCLLKPDYFSQDERIEYGGLYGITIPEAPIESIYKRVNDKDEITKLALYSQVKNKEPIALIDEKLLDYYV